MYADQPTGTSLVFHVIDWTIHLTIQRDYSYNIMSTTRALAAQTVARELFFSKAMNLFEHPQIVYAAAESGARAVGELLFLLDILGFAVKAGPPMMM